MKMYNSKISYLFLASYLERQIPKVNEELFAIIVASWANLSNTAKVKSESKGATPSTVTNVCQITSSEDNAGGSQVSGEGVSPLTLLFSSEKEEEDVKMVCIENHGSQAHRADVLLQGFLATKIMDCEADIIDANRAFSL